MSENKTETKVSITGKVAAVTENRGYFECVVRDNSVEYETLLKLSFKADKYTKPKVGEEVTASGYVSSREYNGKYYTDVRGTYIRGLNPAPAQESSSGGSNRYGADNVQDDSPFDDSDAPF